MIAAAILAGGEATRFGRRDKGGLPIGDARIIDRQLAALREVTGDVLIVTNQPDRYAPLGVPTVIDARPGTGALGGVYTALLASPAPQTLVLACDMPFLTAPFLRHLAARGRDVDLAIPRSAGGYEPLCASYARACADPIRRLLDARRLKAADVVAAGVRVCEIGPDELAAFDPDGTLLLNVNSPRDYARALDALARRNR
jgi:molybdopterin-guanine dinucleotide biosynthesis protein A